MGNDPKFTTVDLSKLTTTHTTSATQQQNPQNMQNPLITSLKESNHLIGIELDSQLPSDEDFSKRNP